MTPEEKLEAVTALAEEYAACRKCGLCSPIGRTRKNVVFGRGNPDAKMLIIGEAPGQQDDLRGDPFMGETGEILEMFLNSFTQKHHAKEAIWDEVFVTQLVMCRPTEDHDPKKNRAPRKDEIRACLPRLHKLINIIDPFVVLLLGNFAYKALSPCKRTLTSVANDQFLPRVDITTPGEFVDVTRPAYVTYHPAALAQKWDQSPGGMVHRSWNMWDKAFKHLDRSQNILRGIPIPDRGDD
jgi:DNA polymerase